MYVSTDGGNSWNPANGGAALSNGAPVLSLAAFDGKLYAGDASGRLYVSTQGATWLVTNSSYPIGVGLWGLASFNGALFAADNVNGDVYRMPPVAASLGGGDGTLAAQTLSATSLNLANSTNTYQCRGYVLPCSANNQVVFTTTDRAGNAKAIGPFAIQTDAATGVAISTQSFPANGAYVSTEPNRFNWIGPSTATLASLPPGTSYYLQVSQNDPGFGNIVISVSTPAVVTSTMLPASFGAYFSTFTLSNAATFYWRVQVVNSVFGTQSPFSPVYSFVTELTPPSAVGVFMSFSSTGGVMGESQISNLLTNVTAQITVQDALSGLAVSTGALAFAGDGHDNPGATAGFGVMYSRSSTAASTPSTGTTARCT